MLTLPVLACALAPALRIAVSSRGGTVVMLDDRIRQIEGRITALETDILKDGYYDETFSSRAARVVGPIGLAAGAIASTLAYSSVTAPRPITTAELVVAQREWGDAIVRISKTYLAGGDYVAAAAQAADELYGYGRTDVLFKPTKAAEVPFRPTGAGALSYFVGGDKVEGGYAEDKGFALGPGGVGWRKVVFDNHKFDLNGATAQAMGEYYFYSAADDSVAKVEYTFGYKRNDDGRVRIYLHHSSLPYPGKKPPPPVVPPPPPPPVPMPAGGGGGYPTA